MSVIVVYRSLLDLLGSDSTTNLLHLAQPLIKVEIKKDTRSLDWK